MPPKVNEMGGGRLKIDMLNSGAVVKPFSVMDATHSGVLDGNHSVPAYWYGKHRAASLFGTGPCIRHQCRTSSWAGSITAAARRSIDELTQEILKLNVVRLLRLRHADTAARLVQEGAQGSG